MRIGGFMFPKRFPIFSLTVLSLLVLGCLLANFLSPYGANQMNLQEINLPPGGTHFFGTDPFGRDLFSMIWYGGRVSLFIGILGTVIATAIGTIYGCLCGLSGSWLYKILISFLDVILSIPTFLIMIFLLAIWGNENLIYLGVAIGITGWMAMARVVSTEVRRIKESEFVLSAKLMGGNFFHIFCRHLFPGFFPAIMFMMVMNVGYAIGLEAILSFLGLGLPMEVISWGSMMALSEKSLFLGNPWIFLVPGTFVVVTLVCISNIGNYFRRKNRNIDNFLL